MIVFCHLFNDRSGSPVVLSSAIKALNAGGRACHLYVGSGGEGVLDDVAIPIKYYWYRRFSSSKVLTLLSCFVSQFCLFLSLSRASRFAKPSVVYVNTLLPFGAAIWGKLNGCKVIYHLHEISVSPSVWRRFLVSIARWTASKIIYVSNEHAKRLPIDVKRQQIVYNPVSPLFFDRFQKSEHKSDGLFNVLMLTYPRSYKGIDEFFQLAELMKGEERVTFHLVLNCSESEYLSFKSRYAYLRNVTIYPKTNKPSDYYSFSDLVLNLTRVDLCTESFGLTLLEAMCFGIPVIAPPLGGPSEIVRDGKDGYLIDSREVGELKARISELASDKDLYQTLSSCALKRSGDFSFQRFSRLLESVVFD